MSDQKNSLANTHIIAIGSGKGGVGKSTVTAGLAFALRDQGYAVGIMDADVYGFSIPRIAGVMDQAPALKGEKIIIPVEKDGVKVISMGSLVEENQALAWRGPMLQGVLEQFINDVEWGELDYLLIDLPPGTGDVVISLINLLPNASFIIVTTPQVTSFHVAARLGVLSQQANMPVIGVIENMAYFECDKCGEKHYIFGSSGDNVTGMAAGLKSELLGRIPLRTSMRNAADSGTMSDVSKTADAREFTEIALKIPKLAEEASKKRAESSPHSNTSCSPQGG